VFIPNSRIITVQENNQAKIILLIIGKRQDSNLIKIINIIEEDLQNTAQNIPNSNFNEKLI